MVATNWSKSVYFSMIADTRSTTNITSKINRLHKKVLDKLKDKTKFKVYFSRSGLLTWKPQEYLPKGNKQKRVYYKVEINKKNTKLNELYSLINSIEPVYYGNKWGD